MNKKLRGQGASNDQGKSKKKDGDSYRTKRGGDFTSKKEHKRCRGEQVTWRKSLVRYLKQDEVRKNSVVRVLLGNTKQLKTLGGERRFN